MSRDDAAPLVEVILDPFTWLAWNTSASDLSPHLEATRFQIDQRALETRRPRSATTGFGDEARQPRKLLERNSGDFVVVVRRVSAHAHRSSVVPSDKHTRDENDGLQPLTSPVLVVGEGISGAGSPSVCPTGRRRREEAAKVLEPPLLVVPHGVEELETVPRLRQERILGTVHARRSERGLRCTGQSC
jgi:hypothetical protein